MKKGFTLVEMLGVLVILALIFILTFPNVVNHIVNGEEAIDEASKKNIIESAKDYVSKNEINRELDNYCLTLNELVIKGYLRKDSISDSLKNKVVDIGISKKKLSYSLVDECSETSSNVITLIGNKRTKVEINGTYTEQGATAKDKNMEDISSKIVKTIYNEKGQVVTNIDTTKLGNYSIEYVLNIDGVENKIYRDVDIVDTTKPIITIPESTTNILPTITTYNLLSGVAVSDNSGEALNVSIKTNLALGEIGTYLITYSAKDSSGNEMIINRKINIMYEVYDLGQLVYFDPVTEEPCNEDKYTGSNTCYKWRVIETVDTNSKSKITVQMDHNLINTTPWGPTNNTIGPITALTELNEQTKSWIRVQPLTYEYITAAGESNYGKMKCINGSCKLNDIIVVGTARARMITGEEVRDITNTIVTDPNAVSKSWTVASSMRNMFCFSNLKCVTGSNQPGIGNTDLAWLIENTTINENSGATSNGTNNLGYWTLSPIYNSKTLVWFVHGSGSFSVAIRDLEDKNGVRPVLTISKSKISNRF